MDMLYKVIMKSNGKEIAGRVIVANSFYKRFKGLMFEKKMDGYDALIIKPCKSVHTFFMKYSIDVIFLSKELKIVKIKRNLRPWRITPVYFLAEQVIEFESGRVDKNLREGDELELLCIN